MIRHSTLMWPHDKQGDKFWRSKAVFVQFGRRFLLVFGAIWLLLEPLALWRPTDLRFGFSGYVTLGFVSLVIALYLGRPKIVISGKLPVSDSTIVIKIGDLFEQQGNIIVGVSDTFDTEIGDIISANSLQGQFQSRIFPNHRLLDEAITLALTNEHSKIAKTKVRGKNQRFNIGTTAVVPLDGNRYFLVAYTKMRDDLRVESDICMLANALNSCWESIRRSGQHESVQIAVVGSGISRIGLSRALLIQFIVLSFLDAQRRSSLTSNLNILVHESDSQHVDFLGLEIWLHGLVRAA